MKRNNNSLNNSSDRVKRDGDFWNDVFDHPYNKHLNEAISPFEVKASNPKRLIKFETFLIKHGQQPKTIIEAKSKRLVAKINSMISVARLKGENRKKSQEQAYQNKELEEKKQCTFAPKINKPNNNKRLNQDYNNHVNNTVDNTGTNTNKGFNNNMSVYQRNVLWANNVKSKRANMKQSKDLTANECSFRPCINDNRLHYVFNNKLRLDSHPYQNIYYLKTQANNKRKRQTSFEYSLPQSTEKRVTPKSSSIKNLNESINALRYELRNYNIDAEEEEYDNF